MIKNHQCHTKLLGARPALASKVTQFLQNGVWRECASGCSEHEGVGKRQPRPKAIQNAQTALTGHFSLAFSLRTDPGEQARYRHEQRWQCSYLEKEKVVGVWGSRYPDQQSSQIIQIAWTGWGAHPRFGWWVGVISRGFQSAERFLTVWNELCIEDFEMRRHKGITKTAQRLDSVLAPKLPQDVFSPYGLHAMDITMRVDGSGAGIWSFGWCARVVFIQVHIRVDLWLLGVEAPTFRFLSCTTFILIECASRQCEWTACCLQLQMLTQKARIRLKFIVADQFWTQLVSNCRRFWFTQWPCWVLSAGKAILPLHGG